MLNLKFFIFFILFFLRCSACFAATVNPSDCDRFLSNYFTATQALETSFEHAQNYISRADEQGFTGIRYGATQKEGNKQVVENMSHTTTYALTYLLDYADKISGPILELGPYFLPLVTEELFPKSKPIYWEFDELACEYIKENHLPENSNRIIRVDLNQVNGVSKPFLSNLYNSMCPLWGGKPSGGEVTTQELSDIENQLREQTQQALNEISLGKEKFHAIVISQVLNYVDFKKTLKLLSTYLEDGGYIFIANQTNYGTPSDFHSKRPKSPADLINGLEEAGFEFIEMNFRTVVVEPPRTVFYVARKNVSN